MPEPTETSKNHRELAASLSETTRREYGAAAFLPSNYQNKPSLFPRTFSPIFEFPLLKYSYVNKLYSSESSTSSISTMSSLRE